MGERLQDFWYGGVSIRIQDAVTVTGLLVWAAVIVVGVIHVGRFVGGLI